jgi:hypothetical protein
MLSWLARRREDSRVYRCIKEMKWELQWANLVNRATILAMAQGVRVTFGEAGMADALDRPLGCSREALFDIYSRMEGIRDQSSVRSAALSVEHAKITTLGVEVWMCTLGAGITPHNREDVVLIWSYLASSFSHVDHAIRNLRDIEKRTREMTGAVGEMLPPIPDMEWKEHCAYVPSALKARALGLARFRASLLPPAMDCEAPSPVEPDRSG